MDFGELLERQIAQGNDILNKIESLRELFVPKNNFGDYTAVFSIPHQTPKFDENQLAALKSEMQRWQNVSMDVLRNAFTTDSSYVQQFQDTISDKYYPYNKKNCMKKEVRHGLDVLDSVKESLSLNLVKTETSSIAKSDQPKLFISHASADKAIITTFVKKILDLGLGLTPSDIAYTSEETYGVEPGESIVKYINENIKCAKVVLIMISPNYKKSEVCLNEMGAAWALQKKCISVVLPGSDFAELGWISSLEKAVTMSEKDKLVSLCKVIANRVGIDLNERIVPLTSEIDEFIKKLKTLKPKPVKQSKEVATKPVKKVVLGPLQLFDVSFRSICLTEGEYILQLDVRMRSVKENVSIKRVLLRNRGSFTGSATKPLKAIELKSYLPQGVFELTNDHAVTKHFVKDIYPTLSHQLLDMTIEKGRNVSISFVWFLETVHECDGWEDLQIEGWELVAQYNVDEEVAIPFSLMPLDDDKRGKYWFNDK